MRTILPLACAALLAIALADDAAAIVRCEAADGRVTYSNTECPPNTRAVRKVDLTPPVIVHDEAAAAKDAVAGADPRAPMRVEPARPRPPADPVQQDQDLTAQIVAQQRDCEARARRLQHLQADLDAASAAARSSAELALRRAQEEYQALCGKRR